MKKLLSILLVLLLSQEVYADQPRVVIKTTMGDIVLQLDEKSAPVTVANFLEYVDADSYNETIFHMEFLPMQLHRGKARKFFGKASHSPDCISKPRLLAEPRAT